MTIGLRTDEDFVADIEGTAATKPHGAIAWWAADGATRPAGQSYRWRVYPRPGAAGHAARAHLRQPGAGRDTCVARRGSGAASGGRRVRIVHVGNFVAFVGLDETVVQRAAAAAPAHATWDNARQITPDSRRRPGWSGKPTDERVHGELPMADPPKTVVEATYSRPYVAHAAMGPSCALAEYRGGVLSVWSHTQGPYPLRAALANVLGLPADRLSCGTRTAPAATATTARMTWRWTQR